MQRNLAAREASVPRASSRGTARVRFVLRKSTRTESRTVAAVMADPRFDAFVRLVAPSSSERYRGLVHIRRPGAKDWPCARCSDLRYALAAHITAGATDRPQPYRDDRPRDVVEAIGLRTPSGESGSYVNLDLDGGYPPALVVAALRKRFGRDAVMVISSSGRPGRFRALLRLSAPMPVEMIGRAMARVLDALGFAHAKACVEIFPARANSRLPFGLGGCFEFTDDDLRDGRRSDPLSLCARFLAQRTVDLASVGAPLARKLIVASVSRPTTRAAYATAVPINDRDAEEHWAREVTAPGMRDAVVFSWARACWLRGWSERQAIEAIRRRIDNGALANSNAAHERGGIAMQIRDVSRRVRNVYHRGRRRLPPQHLSRREITRALTLAESRAVATGHSVEALAAFLLAVLPMFKGAAVWGANDVRIGRADWRTLGGSEYAALRDACGIFHKTAKHRSRAMFGDDARSASYGVRFFFDGVAPSRALVPLRGRSAGRIYFAAVQLAKRDK